MFYKPKVIEFFAGSGLVRQGLGLWFETAWANDVCAKKAAIYRANFGDKELSVKPIEDVKGTEVPAADLAWASFPCQDLSLAGNLAGIRDGARSGLFWQWLRVLDEMHPDARPHVLAVENVVGWLVAKGGANFSEAYEALKTRGYLLGALVINAVHFLPQSRPRAFLIATQRGTELARLQRNGPDETFHPKSVCSAARVVADDDWIWWSLPKPPKRNTTFFDLCEFDAEHDDPATTERLLGMLSPINKAKLEMAIESKSRMVGTGYKRTRKNAEGEKVQRLEIRFDGVAGCLRTPEGGSSRQTVLIVEEGEVKTRLMTVRETARLMGAYEDFKIPGSYNDGYKAMGDAVCAPVAGWLAEHLLSPLCLRSRDTFVAAAE
jgi:DNA (cytosine-5)-methyltransferase 1